MKVKIVYGDDMRRWRFPESNRFESLKEFIIEAFKLSKETSFYIQFTDDEGDEVTITSEKDLNDAFTCANKESRKSLKLFVYQMYDNMSSSSSSDSSNNEANEESSVTDEENEASKSQESSEKCGKSKDCSYWRGIGLNFLENEEIQGLLPELVRRVISTLRRRLQSNNNNNKTEESEMKKMDGNEDEDDDSSSSEEELPVLAKDIGGILMEILKEEKFKEIAEHELVKTKLACILPCISSKAEKYQQYILAFNEDAIAAWIPHLIQIGIRGLKNFEKFKFDIEIDPSLLSNFAGCASGFGGFGGFDPSQCFAQWQAFANQQPLCKGNDKPKVTSHSGVACDECEEYPIIGARFKCAVCENYDLCSKCEAKHNHDANHPLIKFTNPIKNSSEFQFGGLHETIRTLGGPRKIFAAYPPPHHHHMHHGHGPHGHGPHGSFHHGFHGPHGAPWAMYGQAPPPPPPMHYPHGMHHNDYYNTPYGYPSATPYGYGYPQFGGHHPMVPPTPTPPMATSASYDPHYGYGYHQGPHGPHHGRLGAPCGRGGSRFGRRQCPYLAKKEAEKAAAAASKKEEENDKSVNDELSENIKLLNQCCKSFGASSMHCDNNDECCKKGGKKWKHCGKGGKWKGKCKGKGKGKGKWGVHHKRGGYCSRVRSATKVKCICGDRLEEIVAFKAYPKSVPFVVCDICDQKCDSHSLIYHCSNQTSLHPNGYDMCGRCAAVQESTLADNSNNSNNNNNDNDKSQFCGFGNLDFSSFGDGVEEWRASDDRIGKKPSGQLESVLEAPEIVSSHDIADISISVGGQASIDIDVDDLYDDLAENEKDKDKEKEQSKEQEKSQEKKENVIIDEPNEDNNENDNEMMKVVKENTLSIEDLDDLFNGSNDKNNKNENENDEVLLLLDEEEEEESKNENNKDDNNDNDNDNNDDDNNSSEMAMAVDDASEEINGSSAVVVDNESEDSSNNSNNNNNNDDDQDNGNQVQAQVELAIEEEAAPAPAPAPAAVQKDDFVYGETLSQLTAMGFEDNENTRALLVQHKGDIGHVINALLQ